MFLIRSATINMTNVSDDGSEGIDIDYTVQQQLRAMNVTTDGEINTVVSRASIIIALHVQYAGTSTNITLTGRATVAVYQLALLALTYLNTADEPTKDPPRRIDMQIFDGRFFSNVATGHVNISLVNDNRLMVICGGGLPMLTEGSTTPVSIASSLTVSDLDADHMLSSATVSLENAQVGDEIQVNDSARGELTVEQSSGVLITISGQAMAAQYQVSYSITP